MILPAAVTTLKPFADRRLTPALTSLNGTLIGAFGQREVESTTQRTLTKDLDSISKKLIQDILVEVLGNLEIYPDETDAPQALFLVLNHNSFCGNLRDWMRGRRQFSF